MEGLLVMASADGYISRIKISPDGFGKVLYVTHPNGYLQYMPIYRNSHNQWMNWWKRLSMNNSLCCWIVSKKQKSLKVKKVKWLLIQEAVAVLKGTSPAFWNPSWRNRRTDQSAFFLEFFVHDVFLLKFALYASSLLRKRVFWTRLFLWDFWSSSSRQVNILNTRIFVQAFGMIGIGFAATDQQDNSSTRIKFIPLNSIIDWWKPCVSMANGSIQFWRYSLCQCACWPTWVRQKR